VFSLLISGVKDWINARLKDLDAQDEYEVYYPGDYWSVTREEDGIEFQGCCSSSFYNSDVTCNQGAVLLTSHACARLVHRRRRLKKHVTFDNSVCG
jgi:hypothetical protein